MTADSSDSNANVSHYLRIVAREMRIGSDVMSDAVGTGRRRGEWRASKTTLFWSCVFSALAPVAIGFFWGGWATPGEARRMAVSAADKARMELAAEVCVNRFVSAPDAAAHLAALRSTDPWARSDVLVKDGWTAIPGLGQQGDKLPNSSDVGDICAQRLMTAQLPAQHAEAKR
jgi:hypothetical protein